MIENILHYCHKWLTLIVGQTDVKSNHNTALYDEDVEIGNSHRRDGEKQNWLLGQILLIMIM